MKKMLSLLLVLTLTLALAAPALAYEDTDPPQWQQWGYESLEDYLTIWGETEEEYYAEVASVLEYERYAAGYDSWKNAYIAAVPGVPEQVTAADDPPLWSQYGYESREAFESEMCEEGQSYEDFLLDDYLSTLYWTPFYEEQSRKALLAQRAAMGGGAEGIAVMWNGQFIQFTDAAPKAVDGRTMIPVRSVMEQSGAAVDYGDGVVTLTLEDGRSVRFTIGEKQAVMTENGLEKTIEMDVASFAEDGRTYVPVRFFAEALGLSVSWDQSFQTAVILDRDAVQAKLDSNFTIINSYLSQQEQPQGTMAADMKLSGELTVFDTLNGNKTGGLSLEMKGLVDHLKTDLQGKWDFSELVDLGAGVLSALGTGTEGLDMDMLKTIAGSDVEIIMDLETGKYFLRSPALSAVSEGIIPENAWASMDLGFLAGMTGMGNAGADMSGLAALMENPSEMTMGKLICALSLTEDNGIGGYQLLDAFSQVYIATLGDQRFTATEDGHSYSLTDEDLLAAMQELQNGDGQIQSAMPDMELKMDLKKSGSSTGSMDMTVPGAMGLPQTKMTMTFSSDKTRAEMQLQFHMKNAFLLNLHLTEDVTESSDTLRSAPPAGDQVVDLLALLGGMTAGVLGGADGPAVAVG